jgi:predicted RNA binding protein YcfA (HicA-like mRNA interferase family)
MKLPIISGKEVIKFLSKKGFYIDGQKDSHIKMKKKNGETENELKIKEMETKMEIMYQIIKKTKVE